MKKIAIHKSVFLFGILGAALLGYIIYSSHPRQIFGMLVAARWRLCVVIAYHCIPLFFDAVSWWFLFPGPHRPRLRQLYWMRWIGESVSNMLPVLQIGGDLIRARMVAIHRSATTAAAVASVLVDITLSIFTQALFTIAGLSLLAVTTRQFSAEPIVVGTIATLAALAGFYWMQRIGIFRIIASLVSRMAGGKEWQALVARAQEVDDATRDVYRHPRSLAASAGATMTSWVFGTGEVMLTLWALHLPMHYSTAFVYESVGQAIEAGLFFIPGALGVQEGAYIGLGKLLGIPVQAALAIALIRRCREFCFGIPGVIFWQAIEARHALKGDAPHNGGEVTSPTPTSVTMISPPPGRIPRLAQ